MKNAGKILKIKSGYNPNSSSIGTEISAFLWGSAAFTVLVNLIFAMVQSFRLQRKNKKKEQ